MTFDAWDRFRPCFGGGTGMARTDATFDEQIDTVDGTDDTFTKASPDDTAVAYRVMPDVSYPFGDAAEVRLGYRYFETEEAKFEDLTAAPGSHNVETGALLRFRRYSLVEE